MQATLDFDLRLKLLPPAVIDWFMKHVAAMLVPMWHKQARHRQPKRREEPW